jgi:hypothetical protein
MHPRAGRKEQQICRREKMKQPSCGRPTRRRRPNTCPAGSTDPVPPGNDLGKTAAAQGLAHEEDSRSRRRTFGISRPWCYFETEAGLAASANKNRGRWHTSTQHTRRRCFGRKNLARSWERNREQHLNEKRSKRRARQRLWQRGAGVDGPLSPSARGTLTREKTLDRRNLARGGAGTWHGAAALLRETRKPRTEN